MKNCSMCNMSNCKSRNSSSKDLCLLDISKDEDVYSAAEKSTIKLCNINILNGDFLALEEAQKSITEESKQIAIKSFIVGASWKYEQMMKDAITCTVDGFGYLMQNNKRDVCVAYPFDDVMPSKVKLIVIKEE